MKTFKKYVALTVVMTQIFWSVSGYADVADFKSVVTVSGTGNVDRSQPNEVIMNQLSDKWHTQSQSLSLNGNEILQINQPSSSSIYFNTVVGGNPSNIFGTLNANGRVFLINESGILFAPGSHVNVGGLLASTLNLTDVDFVHNDTVANGYYRFAGASGFGNVTNQGTIKINAPGGYAAFLGAKVSNEGTITTTAGNVALLSGDHIAINLDPNGFVAAVGAPTATAQGVNNSGTIQANNGVVVLTAKSLKGLFHNLINNDGIVEANGIYIDSNDEVNLTNTLKAGSAGVSVSGGDVNIHDANISAHVTNGSSYVRVQYDGSLNVTNSNIASTSDLTTGSAPTSSLTIDGNGEANIKNSQVKSVVNSTITGVDASHLITGGSHLQVNSNTNSAGKSGVTLDNSQLESSVNGATAFANNSITSQGAVQLINGTTVKTNQDGVPGAFGYEKMTVTGKSITGNGSFQSTKDTVALSATDSIGTNGALKVDARVLNATATNGDVRVTVPHDVVLGQPSLALTADKGTIGVTANGNISTAADLTVHGIDLNAQGGDVNLTNNITAKGGGIAVSGNAVNIQNVSLTSKDTDNSTSVAIAYKNGVNINNSHLIAQTDQVSGSGTGAVVTVIGKGVAQVKNSEVRAIVNSPIVNPQLITGGTTVKINSALDANGHSGVVLDNTAVESSVHGATAFAANSISADSGDVQLTNGTTVKTHQDGIPGVFGYESLAVSGKNITGDGSITADTDTVNLSATGNIGTAATPLKVDARKLNAVSNHGDVRVAVSHDAVLGQPLMNLSANEGTLGVTANGNISTAGNLSARGVVLDAKGNLNVTNNITATSGGVSLSGNAVSIQNADVSSKDTDASTAVNVQYKNGLNINNSHLTAQTKQVAGSTTGADVSITGQGVAQVKNSGVKAIVDSTVVNPQLITGGTRVNINSALDGSGHSGVVLDNTKVESSVNGATAFADNSITAQTNGNTLNGNVQLINGADVRTHQDGIKGQFGYEKLNLSGQNITTDGVSTITGGDALVVSAAGNVGTATQALNVDVNRISGGSTGTGDVNVHEMDNADVINVGSASSSLSAANGSVSVHSNGLINANNVQASKNVSLAAAAGDLAVGKVQAGDTVNLKTFNTAITDAGSSVQAQVVNLDAVTGIGAAGHDINLTSPNVKAQVTGAGDVHLSDIQDMALAAKAANGSVTLNANGHINATDVQASKSINLTAANGNIAAGHIQAGDEVNLTASNAAITNAGSSVQAGFAVNLKAATGIGAAGSDILLTAPNVSAHVTGSGDAHLSDIQDMSLAAKADNGSVSLSANGHVHALDVQATKDVNIKSSNGNITAGNIQAGNTVNLTTLNADITNTGNITGNAVVLNGAGNLNLSHDITAKGGGVSLSGNAVTIHDANITSKDTDNSTSINVQYKNGVNITNSHVIAQTKQVAGSSTGADVRVAGQGAANIKDSEVKAIVDSTTVNPTLITGGTRVNINSSLDANGKSGVVLDNTKIESSVNGATAFADNSITAETNANSISDPVNGPGAIQLINGTNVRTHQDGIPGQFGYEALTVSGKSIAGDSSSSITGGDALTLSAAGNIGSAATPLNLDVRSVNGSSWKKGDVYLSAAQNINLGSYSSFTSGGVSNYTVKSLAANDGIVSVKANGDIVINSVITPNGGVGISSTNGSIYAGKAGDHGVTGVNSSTHPLDNPNNLFTSLGVKSFDLTATGTGAVPGPNVIAAGNSYLSAPNGTIGVGNPGAAKDPAIGAQLIGTVRPGVTSPAGINPSPEIGQNAPKGIIDYDDSSRFGNPDLAPLSSNTGNKIISTPGGTLSSLDNPLGVFIETFGGAKSALPAGTTSSSGLLVGSTSAVVVTPPVITPPVINPPALAPLNAGLVALQTNNSIQSNLKAYYENLNPHLVRTVEVVAPSTVYAYHPLVENDASAFDNIKLEPDAYDYIEGHINLNTPIAPYLQEEDQKKKR